MSKKFRLVRRANAPFVICVDNADYTASLERRKIYRTKRDAEAESEGLIRVLDESGEDYLYPAVLFRPITLTRSLRQSLRFSAAS